MSLLSIIMAAYNSEKTIAESIESVLNQDYQNWELLIVDDGSTDASAEIIETYSDDRVKYFYQENSGVSHARNTGLENCKGEYICFLDSDDIFPQNSLTTRLSLFQNNPKLNFVDGIVKEFKKSPENVINEWTPEFKGNPLKDLISLSGHSFYGLTWMIKQEIIGETRFKKDMSHAEDLLFFIELSEKGGDYDYCKENILFVRRGTDSAMSNLSGLENGYRQLLDVLKSKKNIKEHEIISLQKKIKSIMFKSYLSKLYFREALRVLLGF